MALRISQLIRPLLIGPLRKYAAGPIVEKYRMPMGIENHKDWRVDEQGMLFERYSGDCVGVTLDTGNNLSVLDDPMETVEKLAPYTVNVHFKDMAVEETETGSCCRKCRSARASST